MPAEAYELTPQREINDSESPSAVTRWQVVGATNYANARAALDAVLPTSFTFPDSRVAYVDSVEASELREDEFWLFTIGYRSQPRPELNQIEFEFSVGADTDRVFTALQTQAFSRPGTVAPVWHGCIGIGFDGPPQGIQPYSPISTFAYTKHLASTSMNDTLAQTFEGIVGKVNSGTFRGRPAGTVRLLGVSGRQAGDKFPVTFEFGFRPNLTSQVFGPITVPSIQGWQVIDQFFERFNDTTSKRLTHRHRAVYVHTIHGTDSFSSLGL